MHQGPFADLIAAQKRGEDRGITSICSAHAMVIEASLCHALAGDGHVLIESTCNQVNQFGGYTGMLPSDFIAHVVQIAKTIDFPQERILMGGDHLGPSPWQQESAGQAMAKAEVLVRDYVRAGYQKIHLDASMKCADDDPTQPLAKELSAKRAAALALAAEQVAADQRDHAPLVYVIGTEVPTPGGAQHDEGHINVTSPDDVTETIAITHGAFMDQGLDAAWDRVIAVVAQPGVEFGNATLFEYDPVAAERLAQLIAGEPQLVFEAHSTDYQTAPALKNLVEDHFAILKVGPALTFALREAIFALAMMEEVLLSDRRGYTVSQVREALEEAMLANPIYWRNYYSGDKIAQAFARQYSFSDRIRYYWPAPNVQKALLRLFSNLAANPLPLSLLSQYAPVEYCAVRAGEINNSPQDIIRHRIGAVLDDYAFACAPS